MAECGCLLMQLGFKPQHRALGSNLHRYAIQTCANLHWYQTYTKTCNFGTWVCRPDEIRLLGVLRRLEGLIAHKVCKVLRGFGL